MSPQPSPFGASVPRRPPLERPDPASFGLWVEIPVAWGDMDAYGHVNNARYFTYCETARMAYFDAVSLDQAKPTPDHGPALVSATCDFLAQVHHPAVLHVGVRATRLGGKSFDLAYGLYLAQATEDETESPESEPTLVAAGHSTVVWVDYASGRSEPLPDALRQRIAERDGQ